VSTAIELARKDGAIARLRATISAMRADGDQKDEALEALGRSTRSRVGTGVSSAITTASGAAAGWFDGWVGSENNKIGPLQITTVVGAALGFLGVSLDDADMAEGASAIARGLAAGGAYKMAFDAGEKRRLAGPNPATAQPAVPPKK
jgi:hypothetical protein